MKIIILFSLLIPNAHAVEFILNGVTYNISEYKISNNGQRIEINNPKIQPVRNKATSRARRVPSSNKSNSFQSLLRDLRSGRNQNSNFK